MGLPAERIQAIDDQLEPALKEALAFAGESPLPDPLDLHFKSF